MDPGHRVTVNMDSALTRVAGRESDDHDDLILTPEYSINEVTMSGVMMYMGWPYYAWSAGYDTYSRADIAKIIYTVQQMKRLMKTTCKAGKNHLYFISRMEWNMKERNAEKIRLQRHFRLVYQSEDGRIRIYETQIKLKMNIIKVSTGSTSGGAVCRSSERRCMDILDLVSSGSSAWDFWECR